MTIEDQSGLLSLFHAGVMTLKSTFCLLQGWTDNVDARDESDLWRGLTTCKNIDRSKRTHRDSFDHHFPMIMSPQAVVSELIVEMKSTVSSEWRNEGSRWSNLKLYDMYREPINPVCPFTYQDGFTPSTARIMPQKCCSRFA